MTFQKWLLNEADANGWTLYDVADKTQSSITTVKKWADGSSVPMWITFREISHAFDVPYTELAGMIDEQMVAQNIEHHFRGTARLYQHFENPVTIGEWIRNLQIENALSLEELSEAVQVSHGNITDVIRGKQKVTAHFITNFISAFGRPPKSIMDQIVMGKSWEARINYAESKFMSRKKAVCL